ncbi:alpha-N-arabinofuranosidase [Granulicella rosea]|uniref:non-reducing end alpha-L-arabinofuranosidase n=1 Tax=Granulicella rosea TaxID=474952 RepID=A0A239LWM7_9BACT|nr:alpha-L-arabinofuranosidase C-terminal domain-containing protein [Granulicella rosea]SNT35057.1 alpha-N-arabinofuranosidase [Granulicella rosea]
MSRTSKSSIYSAVASLALAATLVQAQNATVSIQLDKPAHAVSPTLYGLMTEEINYSYDGGLYAEMVRNRTFQDHGFGGVAHWNIEHMGNAQATMKIDALTGPSEALQHSLLIEIGKADAENPAGVRNEGYWGMPVRPKTTYKGSLYAKTDADLGPLTASLIDDRTGKTLASATVAGLTKSWAKHDFTLTTGGIEPTAQAHLLLTVGHAGKLWIDMVSLFPPTYKNRENGNRPDIMEKMAEMKPKFLRLPGGNYLEGNLIDERFDWKTTIGPEVDRPTHPSPWGYQSSDGMGLLEFLEWTEDLKIDTVLAVYAGYSLRGDHIHPGPQLAPFVDDALDEIEFVTGDASTKWGAVRAKLGHPAPFPVKYIEIGNEDWFDKSGSYEARYQQFYKAIKAKYPTQFQLIATAPLKKFKPDVLDDHYYKRADEFFDDVKHYDTVDRNGPKIFVGEWATREGGPTTNFGAALGDAAWMTGMERNSDLIVMASYAPLFVNVNPGGMQWESNLIGYDAMTSYGAPSFYAQTMFGQYLGTEVPTSTSTGGTSRFFYSVTRDAASGKVFLKLVNASSARQTVDVKLDGAGSVGKTAELVSLVGSNLAETNTLTDPTRILPVKTSEKIAGASFTHTMPGYSIQVLELSTK